MNCKSVLAFSLPCFYYWLWHVLALKNNWKNNWDRHSVGFLKGTVSTLPPLSRCAEPVEVREALWVGSGG